MYYEAPRTQGFQASFTVRERLDETRHNWRLFRRLAPLPISPVPISLKAALEQLLLAAVRKLVGTLVPQMPDASIVEVEPTREAAHGDFASNVAMRLAKAAGKDPRQIAQAIVTALPANPFVSKAVVADAGFINLFLRADARAGEIRRIHELADAYGRSFVGAGRRVTVKYPAGDSHSEYSAALSNVLAAAGYEVHRELSLDVAQEAALYRGKEKLATPRTSENPMYFVQYAHARVASAMKEVRARGYSFDLEAGLDKLVLLDKETEQALIAALLRFPEQVESAAANCAPQSIVYYLREVANAFHTYYNAEKWIVEETDLRNARLALVLAAGQVLRNGLALLGVSAPESM
jgi:arginyl-tRNA synthetase